MGENDLQQALDGDQEALGGLVDAWTPIIQARVARILLRYRQGPAAGRDVRQEVEDLAQDVFLHLFADDGRALRGWRADGGLSLDNFIGLVAERQAYSILRSGKRSPFKEDPTLTDELDSPTLAPDPETAAASRDELRHLVRRLAEELSPLGRQLFELIYVQELAVDEVAGTASMTADAVYAWRSRLRRSARLVHDELVSEDVRSLRTPSGGIP